MESRIKIKPIIYKENKEIISEIVLRDGSIATVKDTEHYKALRSPEYNFFFNKEDGFFVRWGYKRNLIDIKVTKDKLQLYILWCKIWNEKFDEIQFFNDLDTDSNYSLMLPDILDFEVSTKCDGVPNDSGRERPCLFCYKSNNNSGSYISTEDFIKVIDKMPKSLCQCALGIGNIDQPNLYELMMILREKDIVPNLTINGARMNKEHFDSLETLAGAVAISYYNKDLTFSAVYELATVRKMKQINIHFFLSEQTYSKGMELLEFAKTDERLKDLNAIVFLSLKNRGNAKRNGFTKLSKEKFDYLSNYALDNNISIGWDSCSCQKFIESVKNRDNYEQLVQCSDPCESTIASAYINSSGIYYPCSFCEGIETALGNWLEGISVLENDDFLKDVWFNQKTRAFADNNIECRSKCISCPVFDV